MRGIASICFVVLIGLVSFVIVPAQDVPKVIRGGLLNGKAISLPEPEYPAEAKKAGLEGTVSVDVEVDESGAVISATARPLNGKESGSDAADEPPPPPGEMEMRQAAEKAALEARFAPTLLSGVPVKIAGTITYNFVLGRSPSDLNGGVLNGKATSLPKPIYPDVAKAARASGTVAVKVTIDENGDVIAARAVSGHPLLRAAAVDAAKEAKFSPTLLSGQPVKVSGVLTYNFVAPKDEN